MVRRRPRIIIRAIQCRKGRKLRQVRTLVVVVNGRKKYGKKAETSENTGGQSGGGNGTDGGALDIGALLAAAKAKAKGDANANDGDGDSDQEYE